MLPVVAEPAASSRSCKVGAAPENENSPSQLNPSRPSRMLQPVAHQSKHQGYYCQIEPNKNAEDRESILD